MKKHFLLWALLLSCTFPTLAHDFEVDGIYYNFLGGDSVEVTYKGDYYYFYREYEESVTIPEMVTYSSTTYRITRIGNYAFAECPYLTSVLIPETITSIGEYAFYFCSNFTSVTLPNSVTSIGEAAFYATKLATPLYNANVFAFMPSTYQGEYIIPEGITSIAGAAFYDCSNLTSITIPESVTTIGSLAFRNCSSLTSITIPNNVVSFGRYAFAGSGITTPLYSANVFAFLPPSYQGEYIIPEGIKSIAKGAFFDCANLTSVTIPNSTTMIELNAFNHCPSLETLLVKSGNQTYHSAGNCVIETDTKTLHTGCKNSIIPTDGSVTTIGDYAFYGCSSLTSISIPNSVTSIGDYAFSGCSSLTSITIPNSVTSIGGSAFSNCSSLTSISIPNSVTTIGNWAFSGCSSLTSISIPNSVISISGSAFQSCTNLRSVTIGEGVMSIGDYAFYECSSLTDITIPNSVTSIGGSAFSNCSSLTKVIIGESVTSIGAYAFEKCSNLDYIISKAKTPPTTKDDAFWGCPAGTEVTVPCGSTPSYRKVWTYFTHIYDGLVYDFKVSTQDEATGLVQTLQEPTCSQAAIIKALPLDGYKFLTWSDGNTLNPRQITVDKDIDLAALFTPSNGSADVTDVTVVPTDTTAAFTWPAVDGAASYTLIIWADENETEQICTLTFDAAGRLTNLDFSKRSAPAKTTASYGLNFTVTGLDAGTEYGYSIDSKTSDGVVLNSKSGTFETLGGTGVEDIFTNTSTADSVRKVFHNGTIYIIKPNGDTFTIDGRKVN